MESKSTEAVKQMLSGLTAATKLGKINWQETVGKGMYSTTIDQGTIYFGEIDNRLEGDPHKFYVLQLVSGLSEIGLKKELPISNKEASELDYAIKEQFDKSDLKSLEPFLKEINALVS